MSHVSSKNRCRVGTVVHGGRIHPTLGFQAHKVSEGNNLTTESEKRAGLDKRYRNK